MFLSFLRLSFLKNQLLEGGIDLRNFLVLSTLDVRVPVVVGDFDTMSPASACSAVIIDQAPDFHEHGAAAH